MIVGDMEIRLRADIARLQRDMTAARETVTTATNGMARAADAAKSALAGIGLGLGLAQVIQMSDQYTKFTAQLRLATLSTREYGQALASVKAISTEAQSSMADMGTLYAKIANGTRELGTTQRQVEEIAEVVGLGLKVSGATAQEASSAILQLSQSFASGVLRGEEFNAVNEAGPRIMLALADGIGVPVGALKKMAENGLLTAAVMSEALPRSLGKLREEAKEIQTISGAFQVLKDRVMEVTAVRAKDNGSVAALTQGIGLLANNLTGLLTIMTGLTVIKGATWAADWVSATYARIAANRALIASNIESAGLELRKATADRNAAQIAQSRAIEATAAARVEVAADRQRVVSAGTAAEAAIAARVLQFTETRAIVLAEIELEKLRFAAQINAIGRAARVAEMGRLSAQVMAINAGMAASSAELAAVRVANEVAAANAATAGAAKIAAARALENTATAGAAKATLAMRVATGAMNTSMAAASVGAGLLRGALALLGGPIGAIITVLTLGGLAWMTWGNKAKEGNDKALASMEESGAEMIARLDKQIEKLQERNRLQDAEPRVKKITDLSEADRDGLARVKAKMDKDIEEINRNSVGQSEFTVELKKSEAAHEYETILARIAKRQDEATAAFKRGENARIKEWFGENGTAVQKMNHELEEQKKKVGVLTPEMEKLIRAKYVDKGAATAIKQEASAYATLMTAIGEKRAANALELSGYDKLSESQKMTIKLDEAVASGKNKVNAAHIASARAKIAEVAAQEKLIEENKFYLDQAEENLKAAGTAIQSANDEADRNEDLAKTFGMTKSAIENLTIARLEERLAQATSDKGYTVEMAQLEALIDAKKRSAAALGDVEAKEASKKLADQALEDQKKTWESIETTAHDTFVSIFDSGKSAFDRLRDTLKNGLLDLLYQMVIKKWVLNIGASVGLTGASGLAEAAGVTGATGAAGGSTGLIGLAQSASSLYKVVSGGFSSLSGSVADAIQLGFDKTGLAGIFESAAPSVNVATGITGNGAAATMGGSVAGIAAGVLGGLVGGNLISGQFGSKITVGVGTAVGAAIGSVVPVIGTAIGSLVGGLLGGIGNRLFGMGDKEVTATGMSGTLSDSGLTGSNYQKWKQEGGWFRSDKSGTDKTALDPAVTAQFVQGFATIKAASAGFATSIGASTDNLAGYSKSFDIALTKDSAANEKAITDFFTGVGDEIVLRLVPSLAQFNKSGETMATTLQRLAGDFDATNQVAMLLGTNGTKMFGSLTIDSAAARERLIELAGGVSTLSSQATAFAQNYLTEAERMAPVSEAVAAAMASLGLASVTTREQFKTVVQGLDVTTAAGAQQFASMMALSDAFAQAHAAIDATTESVRSAADILSEHKDLLKQYNEATMTEAELEADRRKEVAESNRGLYDQLQIAKKLRAAQDEAKTSLGNFLSQMKSFATSVAGFNGSLALGSLSTLTPEQQYAEARRQFEQARTASAAGDATAQSNLQGIENTFLTLSQKLNGGDAQYSSDLASVMKANDVLAAWSAGQVDIAQASLDALNNQVDGIAQLNATMLTVAANMQYLPTLTGDVSTPVFATVQAPTVDFTSYGNAIAAPLVAEVKALREELKALRADGDRQTGALMQNNEVVAGRTAETIVDGMHDAVTDGSYATNNSTRAPT